MNDPDGKFKCALALFGLGGSGAVLEWGSWLIQGGWDAPHSPAALAFMAPIDRQFAASGCSDNTMGGPGPH